MDDGSEVDEISKLVSDIDRDRIERVISYVQKLTGSGKTRKIRLLNFMYASDSLDKNKLENTIIKEDSNNNDNIDESTVESLVNHGFIADHEDHYSLTPIGESLVGVVSEILKTDLDVSEKLGELMAHVNWHPYFLKNWEIFSESHFFDRNILYIYGDLIRASTAARCYVGSVRAPAEWEAAYKEYNLEHENARFVYSHDNVRKIANDPSLREQAIEHANKGAKYWRMREDNLQFDITALQIDTELVKKHKNSTKFKYLTGRYKYLFEELLNKQNNWIVLIDVNVEDLNKSLDEALLISTHDGVKDWIIGENGVFQQMVDNSANAIDWERNPYQEVTIEWTENQH